MKKEISAYMDFVRLQIKGKNVTNEFLEMLLTIGGIAVGSAILFSQGASSGGTDIIAMIFKRFTNLNIGTALIISDAVIRSFRGEEISRYDAEGTAAAVLLSVLFLCLTVPYVMHYYFLENSVQALYKLYYEAKELCGDK